MAANQLNEVEGVSLRYLQPQLWRLVISYSALTATTISATKLIANGPDYGTVPMTVAEAHMSTSADTTQGSGQGLRTETVCIAHEDAAADCKQFKGKLL